MAKPAPTAWSKADVLQVLSTTELYGLILSDAVASLREPLRRLHAVQENQRTPALRLQHLTIIRDWFLANRDRGPFSFHRCCLMLSLDPEAVRDELRAQGCLRAPEEVLRDAYARRKPPDRRLNRAA